MSLVSYTWPNAFTGVALVSENALVRRLDMGIVMAAPVYPSSGTISKIYSVGWTFDPFSANQKSHN